VVHRGQSRVVLCMQMRPGRKKPVSDPGTVVANNLPRGAFSGVIQVGAACWRRGLKSTKERAAGQRFLGLPPLLCSRVLRGIPGSPTVLDTQVDTCTPHLSARLAAQMNSRGKEVEMACRGRREITPLTHIPCTLGHKSQLRSSGTRPESDLGVHSGLISKTSLIGTSLS
jgi:hypothetical protein